MHLALLATSTEIWHYALAVFLVLTGVGVVLRADPGRDRRSGG